MGTKRMGPSAQETGYLRGRSPLRLRAQSAELLAAPRWTWLLALAVAANLLDLGLSWAAILRYGLAAEANPLPLVAWGWSNGIIGGLAVKAALLAVVVACAAIAPRHTRLLLALVGFAGVAGAVSALIVL
jgi:hypothetical protein